MNPTIETGRVIEATGTGNPLRNAGAPVNAVNEVQTITGGATGGTGTFSFNGAATPAQANTVSAATLQAALLALPTIGAGNVACTGGPLNTTPIVVTFQGALAAFNQTSIVVGAGFTGGTVTVAETTAGVTGTYGGRAAKGGLLIDTTNSVLYQNTGTQASVAWTKVGTET